MRLIIAFLAMAFSAELLATDLYTGAYQFSGVNHTAVMGFNTDRINFEYDLDDGTISAGPRYYLAFQNIEIGALFMFTNGPTDDSRSIDIEGGFSLAPQPYLKVGSEVFGIVKLNESNKAAIQVGFKLF